MNGAIPLMAILPLVACGGGSGPTAVTVERLAHIEVKPASIVLDALGQTTRLKAAPTSNLGRVLPPVGVTWSSSDPEVAQVSSSGLVLAVDNGSATVTARSDTIEGVAVVEVHQKISAVSVRPDANPLAPGNHVPLRATALDRLGAVVHDATFTWGSSDAEVATVDDVGRVTALRVGTTQVEAHSAGASGSADVYVVSPDWPDEPQGWRPITSNPWDALGQGGWHHRNRASESRIVLDSTAPLSQPHVLEDVYPSGFSAHGLEPAIDWYDLAGRTAVFIGMWWKVSDPWQGHESGVNKMLFVWDSGHSHQLVLAMRGPPGGPYELQPVVQQTLTPDAQYLPQNVSTRPLTVGEWHRVELQLVHGTPGKGVIRWWQDGTLLGEYTHLTFLPGGWGQLEIAPTWGGNGGTPKKEDDYFRYDHVYVSGP